jgi:hypothetical protein
MQQAMSEGSLPISDKSVIQVRQVGEVGQESEEVQVRRLHQV